MTQPRSKLLFSLGLLSLSVAGCGDDAGAAPDASLDDVCVPETDEALCLRLADRCEGVESTDNCGASRTVDCGACGGDKACVTGTCKVPTCSDLAFVTAGTNPFASFNRASVEDGLLAATHDARVIVYLQTPNASVCGNFKVMIADETAPGSGQYASLDATSVLGGHGFATSGGHLFDVAADGLSLVGVTTDNRQLMRTTRSARGAVDFGAPSAVEFAAINTLVSGDVDATLAGPVLAADGLELFYSISGLSDAENGLRHSVRASTSVAFPVGERLPPPASAYPLAVGVSSDRLALFVFDNFESVVFTRSSTSKPFVNPNAPAAPPRIASWAHRPVTDCSKLIAMASAGGCQNEDLVLMVHP
jgi:hypothetical protein